MSFPRFLTVWFFSWYKDYVEFACPFGLLVLGEHYDFYTDKSYRGVTVCWWPRLSAKIGEPLWRFKHSWRREL